MAQWYYNKIYFHATVWRSDKKNIREAECRDRDGMPNGEEKLKVSEARTVAIDLRGWKQEAWNEGRRRNSNTRLGRGKKRGDAEEKGGGNRVE